MIKRHIDYYFWMNSDWALLGAYRLEAIAANCDVEIRYKPVDLVDVYKRTGGVLLHQRALERQAYRITELKRWSLKRGVSINPKPAFMCPDAELASRIVIAADMDGLPVSVLYKSILKAQWQDEKNISCPSTLRELVRDVGYDPDRLFAIASGQETSLRYRANTDEAVAAGCSAPHHTRSMGSSSGVKTGSRC